MEMKVVKPPFCSQPVVPGLCPGPRLSRRRTHCWAAVIGSGLASAAAGAGRLITHNIVSKNGSSKNGGSKLALYLQSMLTNVPRFRYRAREHPAGASARVKLYIPPSLGDVMASVVALSTFLFLRPDTLFGCPLY